MLLAARALTPSPAVLAFFMSPAPSVRRFCCWARTCERPACELLFFFDKCGLFGIFIFLPFALMESPAPNFGVPGPAPVCRFEAGLDLFPGMFGRCAAGLFPFEVFFATPFCLFGGPGPSCLALDLTLFLDARIDPERFGAPFAGCFGCCRQFWRPPC